VRPVIPLFIPMNAKTLSFLRVRVNFGLVHAQRITTEITTDTDDVFADMYELSRHKKYASTPEMPISHYEPRNTPGLFADCSLGG
jgi:hypothetical protein